MTLAVERDVKTPTLTLIMASKLKTLFFSDLPQAPTIATFPLVDPVFGVDLFVLDFPFWDSQCFKGCSV